MPKIETARARSTRQAGVRTGRDGAHDFALKMAHNDADLGDNHVYRAIELAGSSPLSVEAAINAALDRAQRTLRHLRWFEVLRTSGHIDEGQVRHYQVTLKVGFTMEAA
jgi:flavin-binding protein dodecin